jgi:hypothetical protein
MPGRALEIALAAGDIGRSFEFWTHLGFGSALTADTWAHPYGVMSAPGLCVGLHGAPLDSPLLTLTRPDIAGLVPLLEERSVEVENLRLGAEVFNELQFADPAGLRVRVLEARTFSPPAKASTPLLGRFDALSWPAADTDAVAGFWERLHVDCTPPDLADDWAALRADIGGHSVAWHSPRISPEPLLVFRNPQLAALRERLTELGLPPQTRASGFARPCVQLTSPEGQKLAILA